MKAKRQDTAQISRCQGFEEEPMGEAGRATGGRREARLTWALQQMAKVQGEPNAAQRA